MMKLIFALMLVTNAGFPSVSEVRFHYEKAATEAKHCRKLVEILEHCDEDSQPLLFGYRGAATMMMAKYTFNHFSKFLLFRKGRRMLEKAIARDPNNVELRYLRFTIQTNSPSFLGYNDEIAGDRNFLTDSQLNLTDTVLRRMVVSYLRVHGSKKRSM